MFCENCGMEMEKAKFCPRCGAEQKAVVTSASVPVSAAVSSAPAEAPQEAPEAASIPAAGVPASVPISSTPTAPAPNPTSAAPTTALPAPIVPKGVSSSPTVVITDENAIKTSKRKYTGGHIALCLITAAVMAGIAGLFAGLYFSLLWAIR